MKTADREHHDGSPPERGGDLVLPQLTSDGGRAEPARISAMLDEIGRIGADADGGVSRLGFTQQEREAHELVGEWLRDLGLSVRTDAAGNTIAERKGRRAGLPAIGTGSHLDSVSHGGRFDGIVGVVASVELARILEEGVVVSEHPFRFVIFAGEEGARFGQPCIGSKAVVGKLEHRDFSELVDAEGTTLGAAMNHVGLDPGRIAEARWDPQDWAAFVELHVEQGRVLETTRRRLGLVDVVSGSTRLRMTIRGRADHSGGTPMWLRADALAAAAEVVLAAEQLATNKRHRGMRATVGFLRPHPNSITTIAGSVTLTVDIRDIDTDRQRAATAELVAQTKHICERRGTSFNAQVIADTSPAVLPTWIREFSSKACQHLGMTYTVMASGASHDAQIINSIVPAGLIFVPSRDGLSHVPDEWTSSADIAAGVDALGETLLRIDRFLCNLRDAPGGDAK